MRDAPHVELITPELLAKGEKADRTKRGLEAIATLHRAKTDTFFTEENVADLERLAALAKESAS